MSYACQDNTNYEQRITKWFYDELSRRVDLLGGNFEFFLDSEDLGWGENWKRRLEASVREANFFMPIITARYFEREWCRQELEWFIAREQSLGRDDLILPIYFIDSDRFEELKRQGDELANAIANHQLVDLREHRQKMRSAAAVRDRHIEELARRLLDALKRIEGLDVPETTPGGDARAPSVLEDVGPGGGPEGELEKRADTSVAETGQTAAPPPIRAAP